MKKTTFWFTNWGPGNAREKAKKLGFIGLLVGQGGRGGPQAHSPPSSLPRAIYGAGGVQRGAGGKGSAKS